MEQLQYVIEDKTIAELLGVQNFSTDEAAILELVKNAYDAQASYVKLVFEDGTLTVIDDGCGMDIDDIKHKWMHVGKSTKDYTTVLEGNQVRVLAGSKGIGRFALARLGKSVSVISQKSNSPCVVWKTDWLISSVSADKGLNENGTKIIIKELRAKWNEKKVNNLVAFLSKTYNDDAMRIIISHPNVNTEITPYITELKPGINCLAKITLNYDSTSHSLTTDVVSDEFLDKAEKYCQDIDLKHFCQTVDAFDEFKAINQWDLSDAELREKLLQLGDFSAEFSFAISPSKADVDKFMYKHYTLPAESLKD